MFGKHCSVTDLNNTHSIIVHHVSRKTVNAGFSLHSCLLTVHAFMKIKETRIKIKPCGIFLDGLVNNVYPVMALPKQPMGCQFINTHNKRISKVFNFNKNIQIRDASQVFYSTLYTSKSTKTKMAKNKLKLGVLS